MASRKQILQPVKIRRLQNFATVQNFAGCENSQPAKFLQVAKIL